jgi:hypothetical protein
LKPTEGEDKPKNDNKELLLRLHKNYKKAYDADHKNRHRAEENIKFANIPGNQWSDVSKAERGKERLMLEFNQLKVMCKRVINEMRANRPQARFLGFEDGDKSLAETFSGMFRNTWNMSDGDSVADYQGEYQVYGGYGVWELVTEYSNDSAFDQDIKIKNVPNPFCVWSDPDSKDMLKRDAEWWIKAHKIKKSTYEERWPDREVVSFEPNDLDDEDDWEDNDGVRIAEFWYKQKEKKTLYLLEDGSTVDALPEGMQAVRQREIVCYKVMCAICSGDAVLEPPTEFCCDEFPFVPVYGEYLIIDGNIRWDGMVEHMKPAQQAYNSGRTAIVEVVEASAQGKFFATAAQADGHTDEWAVAHKKNLPFILYNADPQVPGQPGILPGAQVPVALIQSVEMAKEELNSLAGFTFDPTATDAKNISGKALNARATQGQIATFNYPDNMAKAHKRTGEIFIKMAPKIYDTERVVRTLGADGSEKFVTLNTIDPATGEKINDLSRGKFDIVVNTGPSFQTKRQEAAETLTQMASNDPALMPAAGDLVYKSLDVPYAEEIAERVRLMLPTPIKQHLNKDKEMPPEVTAAMAQVEQMGQAVQQQGQLVEQAAVEAQKEVTAAKQAKSDLQVAQAALKVEEANLKVMEANFKTLVAQTEAKLQQTIADISLRETNIEHDEKDAEKVGKASDFAIEQLQNAAEAIKAEMGEFLTSAAQVVIANQNQPKPRVKGAKAKRVNGELVAQVEYEDGTTKDMPVPRAETIQ